MKNKKKEAEIFKQKLKEAEDRVMAKIKKKMDELAKDKELKKEMEQEIAEKLGFKRAK